MLYLQASPGRRDDLVATFERLEVTTRALTLDGCLSVEAQVPADPDGPMLVTASWAGRDAYQEWLDHPLRAGTDDEINALLARQPWGEVYDIVIAEEARG